MSMLKKPIELYATFCNYRQRTTYSLCYLKQEPSFIKSNTGFQPYMFNEELFPVSLGRRNKGNVSNLLLKSMLFLNIRSINVRIVVILNTI